MRNETPLHHRTRKHKPKLTRAQQEAKEMTKREHEAHRKRVEEQVKHEEELAHREEERQHAIEEERHRADEDRRHVDTEREDEYRKKHEAELQEIYPSYDDFESDEHRKKDPYLTYGAEYEDEDYGKLPCHKKTFAEDEFDSKDNEIEDKNEASKEQNHTTTPLFLAAAANMYLDTTVTKFLQNDISVTKFLEQANDVTVTKFLDTTVTKFLAENDISVTKFLD